jgi:hypothetical protein
VPADDLHGVGAGPYVGILDAPSDDLLLEVAADDFDLN